MTVATALLMLAHAGVAEPQAHEIARYFARATHGPGKITEQTVLNPCARSRLGEGLVDVTGKLRGALHHFAGVPVGQCVPAESQIAFLVAYFPKLYPHAAARFAAGDFKEFQIAWGDGRGN